jgi:D-alanyl-lipoteichoic acid acyltransferase DltB (MBOAT superfamily)
MQYTGTLYFAFLIAVFYCYWLLPGQGRWRAAWLALASCALYCLGGYVAVIVLIGVSAANFVAARLMTGRNPSVRKALLLSSLGIDLGVLGLFKYWNFFLESSPGWPGTTGGAFERLHLNVLAPIGISFFIFQSIGYVVDVYRKDGPQAGSFLEYLLFISFFPVVAAGPIVRGRQLLPQFREPRKFSADQGGKALFLIALGLVKKIAIADYLSANIVDRVFDFPARFSSIEVLIAVYAYALEIYLDFSGYSDIAIGSAMLLGFELPENFNAPYRARNLAEFWRRWHITFSTWLRDYVFFTIAGKRVRNRWILYAGLIVTMLLGGLWHGAGYSFLVWGILHGLGLAVYHGYADLRRWYFKRPIGASARMQLDRKAERGQVPLPNLSKDDCGFNSLGSNAKQAERGSVATRCKSAASVILTFHFVCLTWVFFRADSIGQATDLLRQAGRLTWGTANLTGGVLLLAAIGFIAHWSPRALFDRACSGFSKLPAPVQATLLFGIGMGLYYAASTDVAPFIYSRF